MKELFKMRRCDVFEGALFSDLSPKRKKKLIKEGEKTINYLEELEQNPPPPRYPSGDEGSSYYLQDRD